MNMMDLFYLLIFPGFFFLLVYAWFCEWVDRKAYARFQNRVGPPWFQPFADFIKLLAKEEIVAKGIRRRIFLWLPTVGFAAAATAFFYLPVWRTTAAFSFEGDLIVIIYLLSLPTLVLFLAGWYSTNSFAGVGAVRAVTQLVSYEVPFILALLTPAILAGSMSVAKIAQYTVGHPLLLLADVIAFGVAIIALQAKLERVPFDVPEAETEIVSGPCTEYTGRGYALFRLMTDVIMVVGSALIANLFLGGIFLPLVSGFIAFVLKTLFVVLILALIRAITARIRIEQVVYFCWRVLVPVAIVQVLIAVFIKGGWLS